MALDPVSITLVLAGIKIAGEAIKLGKSLLSGIKSGQSAPAIAQMRDTVAALEALEEKGTLPAQAKPVLEGLRSALAAAEANPELTESAFDLFNDGLGLFQRKLTDAQIAIITGMDEAAKTLVEGAGNWRPARRPVATV